jgi:hypothetical protein
MYLCKKQVTAIFQLPVHHFLKRSVMKSFVISCIMFLFISTSTHAQPLNTKTNTIAAKETPRIQVAILLDVSGSMDGLIEQAKTQLWSMVETLGKASCNGKKPAIELALYEYGRPENGVPNHFIKRISPFTTDLDELSAKLFQLRTGGGDEYCGAVMVQSLKDLNWDANPNNYKVIFIAGNESFRQGDVSYTEACTLARQKGVIINTIYCGDKQSGIAEFWNMNGECNGGTYSNIDQNQKMEDIKAPQDSMIYVLNNKLNGSYITYNTLGKSKMALQSSMDQANAGAGYEVAAKRATVKANSYAYRNDAWDLVDAYNADSTVITKLDKQFLPAEVRNKSTEQIRQYVKQKNEERSSVQRQITRLAAEREKYIANVRKANSKNQQQDLDNAIQTTLRSQGSRYHIKFEN